MTTGEILKQKLGLGQFKYVYIRRLFNRTPNVWIVYLDSYLENSKILNSEIYKNVSFKVIGIKDLMKDNSKLLRYKMSYHEPIENFNDIIGIRDIVIVEDLAGEYLYKKRVKSI